MTAPDARPDGFLKTAGRSLPTIALAAVAAAFFLAALIVLVGLDPGSSLALLAAILVVTGVAYRLIFGSLRGTARISMGRAVVAGAIGVLVVLGVAQAIPYGRDHANPPVESEPAWDSPRTRELAAAACFMCHSNETRWPGYSNVAPISWALTEHITAARDRMNFSDWAGRPMGSGEIAEVVGEGEMPPWNFRLLHPEARLTDAEKAELIQGIRATLGN